MTNAACILVSSGPVAMETEWQSSGTRLSDTSAK